MATAREKGWRAYTMEEAAAHMGVSRSLVYKLAGDGRLVVRRLGGRTFVLAGDIEACLEGAAGAPRSGKGGWRSRRVAGGGEAVVVAARPPGADSVPGMDGAFEDG